MSDTPEYQREYQSRPRGRALRLYHNAKRRAERKNVGFDLSTDWVEAQLLRGKCALSEREFDMSSGNIGAFSPSIDRIDSLGGYTKDNCRVIIWSLNAAFGTWGQDAFREIALAWLGVTEQKSDTRTETA